jgi:hypothetical protein
MSMIPNGLADIFNEAMDSLLSSEFAKGCTLYLPPISTQCPNCLQNPNTGASIAVYNGFGPIPFQNGSICPVCNGQGYSKVSQSVNATVLIYWDKSSIAKAGWPLEIPDDTVLISGFLTDLPNFLKAERIQMYNGADGYPEYLFERAGDQIPRGLGKNRYFWGLWHRVK